MNFSRLKVLLPGRGMLVVVIILGLLLGWFFYTAERKADHLVKRNFNFLNQVASNLNASIDAATAAVPFNGRSVNSCIAREFPNTLDSSPDNEMQRSRDLQTAMATCLNELKDRLVSQGSLVAQNSDIEIRFAAIDGEAPLSNIETNLVCPDKSDPSRGLLVSSIQSSMVNVVPSGVLNMYYMYGAVPAPPKAKGTTDAEEETSTETSGKLPAKKPARKQKDYVAPKQLNCDERIGKQDVSHRRHFIATFTVTIPYEKIRGVDSTESFFDALIIARSDGNQSRVLFSNTEAPLQLDKHSMRKLFRARSGFERFSSIREFELQNGVFHMPRDATGNPVGDPIGAMPFTQSGLIPVVIGGFSQLAFVQPFLTEQASQQDFVLIGIVGESTFNKHKYAVPYNMLSNAFLLLVVGVLSLNFFRLKLIRDRGVIHRSDTVLACISMIGIASLAVVFVVHVIGSRQFNDLFDDDLMTLQDWIGDEFQAELAEKIEIITLGSHDMIDGKAPTMQTSSFTASGKHCQSLGPVKKGNVATNTKYQCQLSGVPPVATLFLLNEKGRQDRGYVGHAASSTPLGFFVGARDYFREIADGGGWTLEESVDGGPDVKFSRYFMQRIESKAAGSLETAISLPVKMPLGDQGATAASTESSVIGSSSESAEFVELVAVGLVKFQSLEHTVMPPGFGFAVFERGSGTVLFHSDSGRNLRENIYRATDDNAVLKAAIVSGAKTDLSLNYKGEKIDANIAPLKNTQWSLLVYHRDSIVDVVNFHFGITALILAGSYILIWVIGLPLTLAIAYWLFRMTFVERLHRRDYAQLPPQWLYPRVALLPQYHKLAILLTLLTLAYIPMLYFWDLPGARLGVLIGLITAPAAWVFLLRGENIKLKPMGSSSNEQFERALTKSEKKQRRRLLVRAYRWFRVNSCLLVLLVAVLPTMLLHNENYDVHEKLWAEYTSWNFVDRLKARTNAYRDYLGRYDIVRDKNVDQLIREEWRGVYLPRTTIYKVAEADDVCGIETSSLLIPHKWDVTGRSRFNVVPLLSPATQQEAKTIAGEYQQGGQYMEVIYRPIQACLMVPEKGTEPLLHQADDRNVTQHSNSIAGLGALLNLATADDGSVTEPTSVSIPNNCDAAALDKLKVVPLLPRNPKRNNRKSWEESEQDSIYIEVTDRAVQKGPRCLIVPGENNEPLLHEADARGANHQSKYMGGLLGALPNIDDQGSMLESFITLEVNSSKQGEPVNADEKPKRDALSNRRLQTVLRDASSQLDYVVHSFFPHTRPVNWLESMLFYLALALFSLAITSMLHGFLMRKFLSREFEENLPELVRRFSLDDLSDGGIVIAPAGLRMNDAYHQLMQELGFDSDNASADELPAELWGMEQIQLVESKKLLIVKDFYAVISDRQLSDKVMALIRSKRDEKWCTLILSDIDLQHWLYHRMHADTMPEKEFFRWEALTTGVPTFMLPRWKTDPLSLDDSAYALPKLSYRRTWQRCSEDEQMVLAGLRFEGVVNPRNEFTLRSLVRRRLIEFRNGHFEFGDNGWYDFVGGQMHRSEFKQRAQRYKNNVWRAFRGPMLLILLVLVLFIAYVAQDEMKIAFSLLGTVGAGAATLNALGSRLRDLRGLTSL